MLAIVCGSSRVRFNYGPRTVSNHAQSREIWFSKEQLQLHRKSSRAGIISSENLKFIFRFRPQMLAVWMRDAVVCFPFPPAPKMQLALKPALLLGFASVSHDDQHTNSPVVLRLLRVETTRHHRVITIHDALLSRFPSRFFWGSEWLE